MKTRYEFIQFKQLSEDSFLCFNNRSGVEIGVVVYYPPWKMYVYQPEQDTVYSPDCLTDIADFLQSLNKAKKEKCEASGFTDGQTL